MSKKILTVFTVISIMLMCTGCYDMVDIEDIASVGAVCIEDDAVTYCVVSSSASEKKYNTKDYTVKTDNIYHGLEKLGSITGKEVSLSHMEAVLFSDNCSHAVVKNNINALLDSTNSHPKSMVAFYDCDTDDIIKGISSDEGSNLAKNLNNHLQNKYAAVTQCTALDLCYVINFESAGTLVPVIDVNDDGEYKFSENVFINKNGMLVPDKRYNTLLTAMYSRDDFVQPIEDNPISVKCVSSDKRYDKAKNTLTVVCSFEYDNSFAKESDEEFIKKYIYEAFAYFVDCRYKGYDLLDVQNAVKKSCLKIDDWQHRVTSNGSVENMVSSVDVKFEIELTPAKNRG